MSTMASAINAAHAYNGGCLVSQTFLGYSGHVVQPTPGLAVTWNNNDPIGRWPVPTISDDHRQVRALIRVRRANHVDGFDRFGFSSGPNVGGGLEIRVGFGGGQVTLATVAVDTSVTTAYAALFSLDFEIPNGYGTTYGETTAPDIQLYGTTPEYDPSSSNDQTHFVVQSFQLFTRPPASPLPAGVITTSGGDFEPMGQGATGMGAPFSAALGYSIIQNLRALDKRIKPLGAFSVNPNPNHIMEEEITSSGLRVKYRPPFDLDLFSTHLVPNSPRGLKIRIVASIQGSTARRGIVSFVAMPAGRDAWPVESGDTADAFGRLDFAVDANSVALVSGVLTVTTPGFLPFSGHSHIRIGPVSTVTRQRYFTRRTDEDASTSPTVLPYVRRYSMWIEP